MAQAGDRKEPAERRKAAGAHYGRNPAARAGGIQLPIDSDGARSMSSETLREKFRTSARRIISSPVIYFVALLGLCAAYLQGGVDNVLDFEGAVAEVRHFGLEPAATMA